jgi:uncharacterized protein YdhG (YjbR/CyaY superfamily)
MACMSATEPSAPSTVEEYLATLTDAERMALERVRGIILRTAPQATERISYKIPVFALHGDLVGLAAQRKHLSLYVMSSSLLPTMAGDLGPYQVSGKGTIHFTPEQPLPEALIETIVRARVRENEAKRGAKGAT